MKIVLIQAYPTYNAGRSIDQWIGLKNREKWIPSILKKLGHDVEYWVGAKTAGEVSVNNNDLPSYTLRYFKTDEISSKVKKHISRELVVFARQQAVDHYIIKGIDGGIGMHLLDEYILKEKIPFSFIIGGEYYNKYVPKAQHVFYETEYQKQLLLHPGFRIFRTKCQPDQLIRLPKSVDTDIFKPLPGQVKKWDILSVGRLISNYKNFDDVGLLSDQHRVAIVGDGPARSALEKKYPKAEFPGYIPNTEIPKFINQARLFFHSGKRDYNPRVISEALACGTPVIAFEGIIQEDVLPGDCGYLISEKQVPDQVKSILSDRERIEQKGRNARSFVEQNRHKESTLDPLKEVFGTNI